MEVDPLAFPMGAVDKKRLDVAVVDKIASVDVDVVDDMDMDVDSELESGSLINSEKDVVANSGLGSSNNLMMNSLDSVGADNMVNSVYENILDSVGADNFVISDESILQENDHPMDSVTHTEEKTKSPAREADNMVNSENEQRLQKSVEEKQQKSEEQRPQEKDHPTDSVTSTEEKADNSSSPVGDQSLLLKDDPVDSITYTEGKVDNVTSLVGEQRLQENDDPMDSIVSNQRRVDNVTSPVGEQRLQENDDPMDSVASTEGKADNLMGTVGEQRLQENDDPLDSIVYTEGRVDNITSPVEEQRFQENDDPMDSVASTEEKADNLMVTVGEQRPQENDDPMDSVASTEGKADNLTSPVVEQRPQENNVSVGSVTTVEGKSEHLTNSVAEQRSNENTETISAVRKEGGENWTTSVGEKRVSEISVGEKRMSEISVGDVLRQNKKARVDTKGDMKRVAEMVLVLSAMGNMRGGRSPTAAEKEIMADAREKLSGLCEVIAPKDIVTRDAVRVVIEDLGLNRTKDQRLCFRPPTMSIKEKLQLSKTKMEESKKFGIQSGKYSPQPVQGGFGAKESNGGFANGTQKFPQDKSGQVAVSGVPDTSSSFSNSLERDASSLPPARTEPMHFRLDGRSNVSAYASQIKANPTGDHLVGKTPTYSAQPPQGAVPRVGFANKVPDQKAEGKPVMAASQIDRSISHSTSQPAYGSTQSVQKPLHGLNYVQAPSAHNSLHNEIAKTVQKFLHPRIPEHPSWTPPSTDYMNKSLTCQACKASVNDTETLLVCDACEKGHHLKCLQSYNQKLIPKGEWHCPNCLIASNGKPLPPKYGRVTRNSSTPKVASNAAAAAASAAAQSSQKVGSGSDQKPNHHLQKATANGDPGGSLRAAGNVHPPSTTALKMSNSREGSGNRLKMDDVHLSEQKNNSVSASFHKATNESSKLAPNCGEPAASKTSDQKNSKAVDSRENCEVRKDSHDGATLKSSDGMDWRGERVQVVEEKAYYNSCFINGVVYKLQDHALFRSNNGNVRPSKLQSMWEDTKTGTKWANVNSCYLPDDLPEVVGRPCSPEKNEVYESNHDSTVRAGSIQGPCEVLPPNKFMQESERRQSNDDDAHPIFLCKWFYDEMKGLFRPVTD